VSQFQIRKDDFSTRQIVDTGVSQEISDGMIRVGISRFAFTANNITYAAAGDLLGYWQFFPAQGEGAEGWGVIPVWGFADVIESKHSELPVGDKIFGYFPPADELIMEPVSVSEQRFVDGTAHRSALPPGYNSYRRVRAEAGYDDSMDDERMLLWPLFVTSFCLWDSLLLNDWYGAEQIIVLSASSKTSIGMAYALADDDNAPRVIGVTSARNLDLVSSLGLYDSSLGYDAITDVDASVPTVVVDMSGNSEILGKLHRHLGDNMQFCINVGITHWEATGTNTDINAQRSEMFFAPAHIQKRIKDWGADGFDARTADFIDQTVAKSRSWLKLKKLPGLDALASIYPDVCAGSVAPDEGLIIEM
jgi:Protein of unknown function (DUF2855)